MMIERDDIVWIPEMGDGSVLYDVVGLAFEADDYGKNVWLSSMPGFPEPGYGWFPIPELKLYCPKDNL